jgi:hypothetical protein
MGEHGSRVSLGYDIALSVGGHDLGTQVASCGEEESRAQRE